MWVDAMIALYFHSNVFWLLLTNWKMQFKPNVKIT